MAGTRNHYERAFCGFLLDRGIRALAVEQPRRPVWQGIQLKNMDFLVEGVGRVLGLDLKGRRDRPWITRTDLFSLMGWRSLLAGRVEPALLFAFFTPPAADPGRLALLPATAHETPAGCYRYCLLSLTKAQLLARPRSSRWGTFGFAWPAFQRAAVPLDDVLGKV